jgi:hypothetical protein
MENSFSFARTSGEFLEKKLEHQFMLELFFRKIQILKRKFTPQDKGAGMEYVHPTNPHIRVRVMPGKPHSSNPCQQKPYVIQKTDRGALDKTGKYISSDAPEAHIPIEEFIYREHINVHS